MVRLFNKGTGNLVADYLYDCGNRRTKKIVYSQTNPGQIEKETNFLYDGWEVCEEQNSAGQTEITYVYGNGIDEILEFTRTANHPLGAGQFFCRQDIQKNVVAITDASGTLVE